jgi:hypothetical protein
MDLRSRLRVRVDTMRFRMEHQDRQCFSTWSGGQMNVNHGSELGTGLEGESDRPLSTPAPKSVRSAVIGIFVAAVLNVIPLWMVFTSGDRPRIDTLIHGALPNVTFDGTQIAGAENIFRAGVVLSTLAIAALLVWLAVKTARGRRWARIGVTVFLVFELFTYLRQLGADPTLAVQLISLLGVVVRFAVVMLLWVPEDSRAFFRRSDSQRGGRM